MAPRIVLQLMQMMLALVQALMASRKELALENLALRQQVAALKRERPQPRLTDLDRLFWANGLRIRDGGLRTEKTRRMWIWDGGLRIEKTRRMRIWDGGLRIEKTVARR